jgi:biotin-(acetyl-CoA carboxylase) ligase
VEGTALGIDDDGALLVATARGRIRLIAGEVHLLPRSDASAGSRP